MTVDQLAEQLLQANVTLHSVQSDLSHELLEEFGKRIRERVTSDVQEALRIANLGARIAEILDQPPSIAYAAWIQGNVLWIANRYEDALKVHRRASQIYAQLGQIQSSLQLQMGQTHMLTELGRYQDAIALADTVREQYALHNFPEQHLARLEVHVGFAYLRSGDFNGALTTLYRARSLFLQTKDHNALAANDMSIATALIALDRFDEALQIYQQARQVFVSSGNELETARIDMNMGELAYKAGDYQDALRHLAQSRQRFTHLQLPVEVATADLLRTFVYRQLNLFPEMVAVTSEIEPILKRHRLRLERGRTLLNRAIAYSHLREIGLVEPLLEKARRIFRDCDARQYVVITDVERVATALQQSNFERGRRIGRRLLKSDLVHQQPTLLARLHLLLAEIELQHDKQKAQEYIKQALTVAEQYHLYEARVQGLFLQGRWLEGDGQTNVAWDVYSEALQTIVQIQTNLSVDQLNIGFIEGKRLILDASVRLLLQLVLAGKRSKAQLLLHLERVQQAILPQDSAEISPEDQHQLAELRHQWHWFQQQLSESPTDKTRDRLLELERKIMTHVRQANVKAQKSIRHTQGFAGESADTFVQQLQAELDNSAYIHYFGAAGKYHALILTAQNLTLVPNLTTERQIQRIARAWHFHIKQIGQQAQIPAASTAHPYLSQFHKLLVRPLATQLQACSQLHITIPAAWHQIPLPACYDGEQYLIEQHAISFVPTVQSLRQTARQPHSPALIVGYSNDNLLPFAVQEAEMVGAMLSAELLLETNATREMVLAVGAKSQLIHVASHAYFRPDNPMFSWIQLADQKLTVADLNQIALQHDPLVVLSACETGRGKPRAGGLMGLARGFFVAGAGHLIASLWRLEDRSSAELMQHFYHQLSQNQLSPIHALASAQRNSIAQNLHPFAWAGYVYLQA